MAPLTRILAATDLSAPARHAVDRGFRLAAEHGARYTVLHALTLGLFDDLQGLLGEDMASLRQHLEAQAHALLAQQLDDPVRNRGITATTRIDAGMPLDAILHEAVATDAELIVLGARGESFLRHALLGSTASRLVRKTVGRPLLVVKQPPHEPYRRLLVPVDFSPASARALAFARRLAPAADIVLLHAYEVPFEGKLAYAGVEDGLIEHLRRKLREECQQRLHHLAGEAGLTAVDYSGLLLHGDPSQQIVAQEQEQDCDLIIMGKHGIGLAEELLLGSVTKHVLSESQGDVLII